MVKFLACLLLICKVAWYRQEKKILYVVVLMRIPCNANKNLSAITCCACKTNYNLPVKRECSVYIHRTSSVCFLDNLCPFSCPWHATIYKCRAKEWPDIKAKFDPLITHVYIFIHCICYLEKWLSVYCETIHICNNTCQVGEELGRVM